MGGIKVENNYNNIKEIFGKSPIGIIFYDKSGRLIYANQSALKIMKIPKLEHILGNNLFEDPNFTSRKESLLKYGLIKFQAPFNFDNIKGIVSNTPARSEITFIDYIASVNDLGFLVQIKDIKYEKSKEPLQESEEKYRQWFEDDLTGDFIATPEGEIIECNPAFAEIYGFDNRENAIRSDISKFNPNDWTNLIARLKKEYKIYDYQTWHKRPDGKEIHVVANVIGIFNNSNELIQVKGYIFDDTERKKAEEALIKSEKKYHLLFDEDLTGDFIATPEGEIIECNPAFAEIYGFYDCKQALQWNISQSNPFDWPYIVTQLKSKCKIQGFQSWQRRSDGMRIHIIANVVGIFNDSNELIQVKGYIFDDTERKKAEEELTRSKHQITEILDSIQDSFVAISHHWHFIYVNRCAGEYFGVDSDDIIGQSLWERFPELVGTTYEIAFRNAMENQEIQHFEAPGMHMSDQWYDFSVYPSAEGISVFWRDITERKKMEEELRQARNIRE